MQQLMRMLTLLLGSAFMLVGQQHGNCTVGEVVKDRKAEVSSCIKSCTCSHFRA